MSNFKASGVEDVSHAEDLTSNGVYGLELRDTSRDVCGKLYCDNRGKQSYMQCMGYSS